MRVISLYQPYASLCIIGAKQFETRGWDTKYRGLLAIHATKGFPTWCKQLNNTERFRRALKAGNVYNDNLPFGAIIGTVELVRTMTSESWLANQQYDRERRTDDEFHFGDYSPGRFAWELRNPIKFANPIPAKGAQGFWNFDLIEYDQQRGSQLKLIY